MTYTGHAVPSVPYWPNDPRRFQAVVRDDTGQMHSYLPIQMTQKRAKQVADEMAAKLNAKEAKR